MDETVEFLSILDKDMVDDEVLVTNVFPSLIVS